MLSFGNTTSAAQIAARPRSSFPFYEKLSIYVSPRVSGDDHAALQQDSIYALVQFSDPIIEDHKKIIPVRETGDINLIDPHSHLKIGSRTRTQ